MNIVIGFVSKYKKIKIKMKDFFPESLGQKRGCTLYTAKYSK